MRLRVKIQYEIQRIILKLEKKKRGGKIDISYTYCRKLLNYTTVKPLHHKTLGGVFLFSFTFSMHIRAYQSLPDLVYYWSQRGAGVIAPSLAQGSLQRPQQSKCHTNHIGSITLVDKSGFMSLCACVRE